MTAIGVVGLGTMGSRIAGRLLDTGYEVHATNRTRSRAQTLVARGVRWEDTPRAVAESTEVVLSMVTDDAALRAVTGGPDGILAGLAPGDVYVDTSSVSPQVSVEIAGQVRALGAWMLDAPVSGSVPQAEHGELAIMVGGDETAFRQVQDVLAQLGHPVTHVGTNGHGVLLKLAINISLASQMLAFSEGMLLAQRGGIDPGIAAQVMTGSPIGSPMLRTRAPLVLDLPEPAWFDMRLMHKDIRLALQAARRSHLRLPATAATDHVLSIAEETGYGDQDIAAMFAVLNAVPSNATTGPAAARPSAA
jgi:3-hydroxyisobutyrate dehydrogenase-like beta-hydroxyacid dehydrogenase